MKLWILPLGGKGLRVKKLGRCKPLIKIDKKYIIEWFLLGIKEYIGKNDKILIVALKDDDRQNKLKKKISQILKIFFKKKNVFFKILNLKKTLGPAHTVFMGIKDINFKNTTIIANPDQFVKFNFPLRRFDAFVPIYFNDNNDSSYVKLKNSNIYKIAEKKKISHYASSGIYGFKNLNILKYILNKSLKKQPDYKKEYYIGPSINFLKNKNKIVPTKTTVKFDLGSIKNINYFKKTIKNF